MSLKRIIEFPKKFYILIGAISVIFGLTVIGISCAVINKSGESNNPAMNGPLAGTKLEEHKALVLILSITITALLLQIIASTAFILSKEREATYLITGFIGGQFIIQTILVICLGLILYETCKAPNYLSAEKDSPKHPTGTESGIKSFGKGFWIVLLLNIIFHVVVILCLIIMVFKRSNSKDLDTEEMTAIVVHRKVPSRVPKERRHGMQNLQ